VLAHVMLDQLQRDRAITLYETAAGGFRRNARSRRRGGRAAESRQPVPAARPGGEALSIRSGSALGEHFDISEIPSATLWLRMRHGRSSAAGDDVLVLADPAVPAGSPDGLLGLSALPGARREADTIARILNLDPAAVRRGPEASERFLKHAALARVGVVHIAAHARADTTFPERSAVFLAPGDGGEDGWLQPSEIADLDFRGRLIVLSACDSAEGSLLSGEGPLSLARAFFAAGARDVVATRWPLRDDDAAFMMQRFYAALDEGQSVSTALRLARQDAMKAGLPAAAWAGLSTLGDGLHRPVMPRATSRANWPGRTAMLVTLLFAAVFGLRRSSSHRHRCSPRVLNWVSRMPRG
jgi:CHAT domain-containing protein